MGVKRSMRKGKGKTKRAPHNIYVRMGPRRMAEMPGKMLQREVTKYGGLTLAEVAAETRDGALMKICREWLADVNDGEECPYILVVNGVGAYKPPPGPVKRTGEAWSDYDHRVHAWKAHLARVDEELEKASALKVVV